MKRFSSLNLRILKFAFLFALFSTYLYGSEPWLENYQNGLHLIDQKQYDEAISFLKMSIADRPMSSNSTEGSEYFPYLQLGICYFHLGKSLMASEYFQMESNLPAIQKSHAAKSLLESYKKKVELETDHHLDAQTIRDFKKRPYLLSENDLKNMKDDIRKQCRLPSAPEKAYPWYYHYELGLRLAKKNDWQRALDSFLIALDHRGTPEKFSRIYGMWFIDYHPFYQIGMAHYNLQNWKCAATSFRLSNMMEDISKDSPERMQRENLEKESEAKISTLE